MTWQDETLDHISDIEDALRRLRQAVSLNHRRAAEQNADDILDSIQQMMVALEEGGTDI